MPATRAAPAAAAASSSATPAADSSAPPADDVVLRIPVRLRQSRPNASLYLFQYPLRPRWRPYALEDVDQARIRPRQRRVTLALPLDQSEASCDPDAAHAPTHLTLESTLTTARASYAIGMLRRAAPGAAEEAAIHLTPLDASIQLRPSFAHVDEDEARKAAADGDFIDDTDADGAPAPGAAAAASSSADADAPGPAAPIAPTFHPAQTQREIDARNRSYAHHLEQQEAEPWRPATLVAEEAAAAVAARERVFVGARAEAVLRR